MKAKIYRIVLPCGGTYVGQTKKHVYQRWGLHLTELDRGKHYSKPMQESFDNGEVDDWKWEIIEVIETDDKAYINLMEQHHAALESNLINARKIHVNEKARNEIYKGKYYNYQKKDKKLNESKYHIEQNRRAEIWYQNNKEKKREYNKKYKAKLSATHEQ